MCWGNNWADRATPPRGLFTALSTGDGHSCGVRVDGAVVCWGEKNIVLRTLGPVGSGVEGLESGVDESEVVPVGVPGRVSGLRFDGRVIRWDEVSDAFTYVLVWKFGGEAQRTVADSLCCGYGVWPVTEVEGVEDKSIRANVRAVNSEGVGGPWSGWVTVFDSDAAKPGKASSLEHRGDEVIWQPVPNAGLYKIQVDRGGVVSQWPVACRSGSRNCRTMVRFDDSETVRYRVVAQNSNGYGPWSRWVTREAFRLGRAEITGLEQHTSFLADDEDVTVKWDRVFAPAGWESPNNYEVRWRHISFDSLPETDHDGLMAILNKIDEGCEPTGYLGCGTGVKFTDRGGGSVTVRGATEYRVEDVADTEWDKNFHLQFSVRAVGSDINGEWSRWKSLSVERTRETLLSRDGDTLVRDGQSLVCKTIDATDTVLSAVSVFKAAYEGSLRGVAWAAFQGQTGLSSTGSMFFAIKMLEGCYDTPVDALADLPGVGGLFKTDFGRVLEGVFYRIGESIAETPPDTDPSDAAKKKGWICRAFGWVKPLQEGCEDPEED